jgi:hypothetical protein
MPLLVKYLRKNTDKFSGVEPNLLRNYQLYGYGFKGDVSGRRVWYFITPMARRQDQKQDINNINKSIIYSYFYWIN